MQTQSNEKRCINYTAKDYEKQLAILRRKLEDAETQRAKKIQMRSLSENLLKATKADVECKQFASLRSQVAKMMAKIDVGEKELEEANAAAESYAPQLATAAAQLDAFKKDSGDHVKKFTEQLKQLTRRGC